MDQAVATALDELEVSPETKARFTLFADSPGPQPDDYYDPTPTTVALTVGQVNALRSLCRTALQSSLDMHYQALQMGKALHLEEQAREALFHDDGHGHDHSPNGTYTEILDLVDALTRAWADVKAGDDEVTDDQIDEALDAWVDSLG